jgi:hypothetical protein
MDDFVQAFADFFSWASGWTFEYVYTIIVDWLGTVMGWDFHHGQ